LKKKTENKQNAPTRLDTLEAYSRRDPVEDGLEGVAVKVKEPHHWGQTCKTQ
jgi:hypothetical protein